MEIHVGERPQRLRERHAAVDHLTVDALARGVEGAAHVDDVAQLQRADRRVGDRRGEMDLVHRHVIEPRHGGAHHSIPDRR